MDVLLKEYESLRGESLDSMGHQNQVVAFGLGAVAAVAGGALALSRTDAFLVAVFDLALPAISVLVLFVWLGEVNRMMRAGAYLVELEARINVACGDELLRWEQELRQGNQMIYPYLAVITLFLGIAFAAPVAPIMLSPPETRAWFWAALSWTTTAIAGVLVFRSAVRFR